MLAKSTPDRKILSYLSPHADHKNKTTMLFQYITFKVSNAFSRLCCSSNIKDVGIHMGKK